MGYLVSANLLRASDFGAPQRRQRWYILAIRLGGQTSRSMSSTTSVSSASATSMSSASFQRRVADLLSKCKLPQLPVETFLLPADNPCVEAWLGAFRCGPGASKRCAAQKWEQLHKNYVEAQGLPWPAKLAPSQQQCLADAVQQSSLTEREASVLSYLLLSNCDASIVDLSQSINRLPMAKGMTPTVMPCGALFSLSQMRFLVPPELFALQGLPFKVVAEPPTSHGPVGSVSSVSIAGSEAPRLCKSSKRVNTCPASFEAPESSWAFLAELAGNAFCGHCAAACLIAILSCV
jgi:hypothetical protein